MRGHCFLHLFHALFLIPSDLRSLCIQEKPCRRVIYQFFAIVCLNVSFCISPQYVFPLRKGNSVFLLRKYLINNFPQMYFVCLFDSAR